VSSACAGRVPLQHWTTSRHTHQGTAGRGWEVAILLQHPPCQEHPASQPAANPTDRKANCFWVQSLQCFMWQCPPRGRRVHNASCCSMALAMWWFECPKPWLCCWFSSKAPYAGQLWCPAEHQQAVQQHTDNAQHMLTVLLPLLHAHLVNGLGLCMLGT